MREYASIIIGFFVFLTACKTEETPKTILPKGPIVKFEQPLNNANVKRGSSFNATIYIAELDDIQEIIVSTKDSIYYKGLPTNNTFSMEISTINWRVGTNQLTLDATLKNGKTERDNRIIRILSDVYPADYSVKVVNVFPHKTTSYTQGLEFEGNQLYEGTGGQGSTGISMLAKVDFKTGEIQKKFELGTNFFGEGITILGDKIYQLTWQQNKAFVYNKDLERINDFTFQGEGWGLTNDGTHLIMSDGSERLYFRDPSTFGILRTIEVYSNNGPLRNINELEFVNGRIYANIYQSNNIVIIHPETGIVEGIIDCAELALEYRRGADVLNGIAYHSGRGTFFLTGKNWSSLIEVEFVKQQ